MSVRSNSFLFQDNTEWKPAGPGMQRQVMGYDEQIMLVKVKFQEGAVGAMHSHTHSQTTYVASGIFEFTVDGEIKVVKEGDGIYISPNLPHGTKCIEAGVLIDVFSPMREDFI
ncbi:MAG: cupin domain-containing protein [Porphyromonadaceae bacterium]|nr:cupin domain-containing protein [Porphyromonadaceae bacterium]